MATTQQNLADARAAYHSLMTGTGVVEFRDSNGETVKYQSTSKSSLLAYIQQLEAELAADVTPLILGPMRFLF